MAVDAPTVDEVLARFPALEDEEELVTALLPEAIRQVNERWSQDDQKPAILYLVAHMVVTERDAGGGVDGGGVAAGDIASESLGPLSVSYRDTTSGANKYGEYGSTIYGKRFLDIKRRNFGGPIVGAVDSAV